MVISQRTAVPREGALRNRLGKSVVRLWFFDEPLAE